MASSTRWPKSRRISWSNGGCFSNQRALASSANQKLSTASNTATSRRSAKRVLAPSAVAWQSSRSTGIDLDRLRRHSAAICQGEQLARRVHAVELLLAQRGHPNDFRQQASRGVAQQDRDFGIRKDPLGSSFDPLRDIHGTA